MNRRAEVVSECEKSIALNLDRLANCLGIQPQAVVWWHVSPVYPWQSLWTPMKCVNANLGTELRPAPRGAIGIGENEKRNDSLGPTLFVAVDTRGMCFRGKLLYSHSSNQPISHIGTIASLTFNFFAWSSRFYEEVTAGYPGMMLLSIGFENVRGQQMAGNRGSGPRFPDETFRVDQVMTYSDFLAADFSPATFGQSAMMNDLRHAFGISC